MTTVTRSPLIPNTPTMQESGLAGYEVTTWYALWAIRGTPQPIIDRMFVEVAKVLQMPDIKEIWATQGAVPGGMPPAEFDKLVKSEIAKWGKVVKDAGDQDRPVAERFRSGRAPRCGAFFGRPHDYPRRWQ